MMGLFGKSPDHNIPSKIWKTRDEALKGMSMEAMKEMKEGNSVAIVTFFDDKHEECRAFLTGNGIPFHALPDVPNEGGELALVPSSKLDASPVAPIKNLTTVFFYGRYPMRLREEVIAGKMLAEHRWFCLSMEDPFFKTFGGENMLVLMERLGLQDGECIEHKMVDKAISRAQEKLASKVRNELRASSETEWFQKNT